MGSAESFESGTKIKVVQNGNDAGFYIYFRTYGGMRDNIRASLLSRECLRTISLYFNLFDSAMLREGGKKCPGY